jgi:hypothetical protein
MKNHHKHLYACLLGISALAAGTLPAAAATSLGAASDFAVLSAAPGGIGAVTCTDSTIAGSIGSSGAQSSVVQTSCTATGAVVAPVATQVLTDFNAAYAALASTSCDQVLTGTLSGVTLAPGVYCFDAAATVTGTLTLQGPSTGSWLFKVGTSGTGALTGTNFSVVLNGASACNVTWWVAEAATMTDSNFKGSILAGAAITATGSAGVPGTFEGRALAKAAVTFTNQAFVGCQGGSVGGGGNDTCDRDDHDYDGGHDRDDRDDEHDKGGKHSKYDKDGKHSKHDKHDKKHSHHCGKKKESCNQGVGNKGEDCDPGNSNQGYPFRSNDEMGGKPGNPGRKGGNK